MKYDVIIIGAGIHGCCTGLQLARRGIKTLIIEKNIAGRHASGVNAGGVRTLTRSVHEIPLSLAAMDKWYRLDDLLGADLAENCQFIGHVGQIALAENQAEIDWCEGRAAETRALGYDFEEVIDEAEIKRLIPHIADGSVVGGLIARKDGHANPFRTSQSFRIAAERAGCTIIEGRRVTGFARKQNGWIVETDGTQFECGVVVNTAGAWAWKLAEMIGEKFPNTYEALSMMVTARMQKFIDPVVFGLSRALSFKQSMDGTLVIGGGILGIPELDNDTSDTVAERLAESARHICDFFPLLRQTKIVRTWSGLEAILPDMIPVIGASRVEDNFFHAFGFCGHGFQLGPIVGSVLTDLIVEGKSSLPIESFSAHRFGEDGMLSTV